MLSPWARFSSILKTTRSSQESDLNRLHSNYTVMNVFSVLTYCVTSRKRRPISQTVYELITEISDNALCSNLNYNDPNGSQLCRCHDSSAAMKCAKLWPDLFIINHVRATSTFYIIWILPGLDSLSGRFITRSREVSKPRDWGLDFFKRSEIWQAPRQQRCRDACQISERYDHYNIQSPDFETSRDLAVRRLTA